MIGSEPPLRSRSGLLPVARSKASAASWDDPRVGLGLARVARRYDLEGQLGRLREVLRQQPLDNRDHALDGLPRHESHGEVGAGR